MTDHGCLFIAVAELNNIAVHLLQHNSYLEAISTLKDAIQLTKNYFCCVGASSSGSVCGRDFSKALQQRADIDRAIHAAHKRKDSIHQTELTKNEIDGKRNPIKIIVASDKDAATAVYRALQQNPNDHCCITVDTDFSDMLHDGLQLQSTILFYNYGIAFRCMAEIHQAPIDDMDTTTTPATTLINTVKTHLDKRLASFKILQLSHTLISRSIHVPRHVISYTC